MNAQSTGCRAATWIPAMVLLALAAGCASGSARPFEPGAERYHFAVAVVPVAGEASAYSCVATVTDLQTRTVLSAPPFVARAGRAARGSGEDRATGARLEVTVTVEPSGRTAAYSASLTRAGRLLASSRETIPVGR
jgi:hypothetical protein